VRFRAGYYRTLIGNLALAIKHIGQRGWMATGTGLYDTIRYSYVYMRRTEPNKKAMKKLKTKTEAFLRLKELRRRYCENLAGAEPRK